jgi:hypothetical protein
MSRQMLFLTMEHDHGGRRCPMAALVPPSLRWGMQQPTKNIGWSFSSGEGVLDSDGMPLC